MSGRGSIDSQLLISTQTTSMEDMLTLIDILAVNDSLTAGDFWRDQPFVKLPQAAGGKGQSTHRKLQYGATLDGVRVAVPVPVSGCVVTPLDVSESEPGMCTQVTTSC
jgi:hypothetical protein